MNGIAKGMVHVAAHGEGRGRVVMQVRGAPNRHAVAAALKIAHAYQSQLESLFVEDEQLADLTGHAFVREVSYCGARIEPIDRDRIEAVFLHNARRIELEVRSRAAALDVPWAARVVRDEPSRAVALACAQAGPWNILVLADPMAATDGLEIRRLLAEISGLTAIVAVGPRVQHTDGAIVIVLEDLDRLAAMRNVAERLAGDAPGTQVVLLPLASDRTDLGDLEGQLRLVLGASEGLRLTLGCVTHGSPIAAAAALRPFGAGLVVAEADGVLLGRGSDLSALLQVLDCPLLVIR
jgi:hypothetical protein